MAEKKENCYIDMHLPTNMAEEKKRENYNSRET